MYLAEPENEILFAFSAFKEKGWVIGILVVALIWPYSWN